LTERRIPEDWETSYQEEVLNLAGCDTFIDYVCDGLSYEQFVGEPAEIWMDLGRLDCVIFFLESLGLKTKKSLAWKAKDLEVICRLLLLSRWGTKEISSKMEACLKALNLKDPDVESVKKLALEAIEPLQLLWDRRYLSELVNCQELAKLDREIRGPKSFTGETESQYPGEYEGLLAQIKKVQKMQEDEKLKLVGNEQFRQELEVLCSHLEDEGVLAKLGTWVRSFDGLISDKMKQVASGLRKGMNVKPSLKKHRLESLRRMMSELRPYDGNRAFRPYELFLLASQNGYLKDDLIRNRSSLASGEMPNAPRAISVSILESHQGVPWK